MPMHAVRVKEPIGAAHEFRGQVAADETVEPRGFILRQIEEREARHNGALRQFELAAEGALLARMQAQCRHRPGDLLHRAFGRERDAHRPLAPLEKPPETLAVLVGFGETEQFEIVGTEHDAVIGRALPDVAAARRRRKSEPGPARPRAFELAHRDNHMIDASQAVTHGLPSRMLAECTEAAIPRPWRRSAAVSAKAP